MTDTARTLPATPRLGESGPNLGDVAVASLHAMGSGTLEEFSALYTPDATNREAVAEPRTPAAQDRKPCTPPPAGCAPRSAI